MGKEVKMCHSVGSDICKRNFFSDEESVGGFDVQKVSNSAGDTTV